MIEIIIKSNHKTYSMKKIVLIALFPFFTYAQTQIGQDINGEQAGHFAGEIISISADGNIIAVGSTGFQSLRGHVRVFENEGGNWVQIGQSINGEAIDDRASIVSLSSDGSIVAIGAGGNDENGNLSGHVRVYENQNGNWIQIGQDIDGEGIDDRASIVSLSSDGSIVAIGSSRNDGNGGNSGHVRVYENQNDTWVQIGSDIDGEAPGDRSGFNVSLSADGTILAIGANQNDGNGSNSGHVRVFENQNNTWIQIGDDIDGEEAGDNSGNVSLSSDGTIVAVGSPLHNSATGQVRVFENQGGVWTQIGNSINGEAINDAIDQAGFSFYLDISADGNIVAVGAIGNDENGQNSGHLRVYRNQGGTWVQVGEDIDGDASGDFLGLSVNLSSDGSIVAVGAYGSDNNGNNSGLVRVYDLSEVLATDEIIPSQFSIYPNPATTSVTIQLQEELPIQKVAIYNSLGQLLKTITTTTVDTSNLSQGVYIVKVQTSRGISSRKLIIE